MDIKRLTTLIGNFSSRKVLVVGDVMLDEYIFGSTTRLSPEAPIPVVKVEKTVFVLGGAANVANNLRSLGAEVDLVGVLGRDSEGRCVSRLLKNIGINNVGIFSDGKHQTTVKRRIVSRGQHIVRVDRDDDSEMAIQIEKQLLAYIDKKIKFVDAVIISDYAKGVVTRAIAQKTIRAALRENKPVVVDPKGSDFSKYRKCSLITPNVKEMEEALRTTIHDLDVLPKAMVKVQKKVKSRGVLAKLGDQGMALLDETGKIVKVAAVTSEVVDISGAGDTAVSVLALCLASVASLSEAMFLANVACGVVVGKAGTAVVSSPELLIAITT